MATNTDETNSVVDLTLVDAALQMSPEQRLEHNDRMATMAEELRAGVEAAEPDDA